MELAHRSCAAALIAVAAAAQAWGQTTTRVSLTSTGVQGGFDSSYPSVSADGRYVAFASETSTFSPGDINGVSDVFVRDRQNGVTARVSLDSAGAKGDAPSIWPSISADGRYVAFWSFASNLVPGDTNGMADVFVRDRQTGVTTRVSVDSAGAEGNSGSREPSISADGRYVAFDSTASNLVPADTNGADDVFVRDLLLGVTTRASVDSSAVEGNSSSVSCSLSADARYVAFYSAASNLVPGDTNGALDVFVRDLQSGVTTRASVDSAGAEGNSGSVEPSISGDGRYVAFHSYASDLVPGDTNGAPDVFVRDLQSGVTTRTSVDSAGTEGSSDSGYPSISSDGRYVAFHSVATNLVPADSNGAADVFVRDLQLAVTSRASVSSGEVQGNAHSVASSISTDGRYVAFDSFANDLVLGDTNTVGDVFVRDRDPSADDVPFCFGDGTNGPCPCNNSGGAGRGCENSGSTGGALLTTTGDEDLSADTLVFTSSGERPTALTVFLQGTHELGVVNFGDGLRCLSGTLKRLYVKSASGGVATAPVGGDASVSARSSALADPIPSYGLRYYVAYYRDSNPTFCPEPMGSTFNSSNGRRILWIP